MTTQEEHCLPDKFGTWDEFERDWCLDTPMGYSREEIARALQALRRLAASEFESMIRGARRGVGVVVPYVERGRLLADCERLPGFDQVARRLTADKAAVYSELVLGSSLCRLRYEPSLEPPCEGKKLDARCEVDGVQVFFEVVAPRFSDAFHDASKAVEDLRNALQAAVSDCRLEIEIWEPLTSESQEAIVAAARTADDGAWVAVEGVARIRKIAAGSPLPPNFDGDGTQVRMAGDTDVKGPGMSTVIRWENDDSRAKRIFKDEYRQHFSERVANVLVMNAAPAGGLSRWSQLIQRLLQPDRNRKVGAVALFHGGMLGPPEAIRRRWHVIVNSHAHHEIPARLVDDLRSLDESRYFGLGPTPKGT